MRARTKTTYVAWVALSAMACAVLLPISAALAAPPNVSGNWLISGKPKSKLKLSITQDDYRISGYFRNESRRWQVMGFVDDQGVISMFRWIPVSELTKTDAKGRDFAVKVFGDKTRKDFLLGNVSLQVNSKRRTMTGTYDLVGITGLTKSFTKPVPISLEKEISKSSLIDKNIRFHRLLIVGPGSNRKEARMLNDEALRFRDLLEKKSINNASNTSHKILPNTLATNSTPTKMTEIKRAISGIVGKLKSGDQVTIFISAHGWGGGHSRDLSSKYETIFLKKWDEYLHENTTALMRRYAWMLKKHPKRLSWDEYRAAVKATNKRAQLKKQFPKVFTKMISDGVVKKVGKQEFFLESVWLTDPNRNMKANAGEWLHDTEFAALVQPIIDGNYPLTVIMDSCFGGGFADNLKSHPEVTVIGLRTKCPSPTSGDKTLTENLMDLVQFETNNSKTPAQVTAQDAKQYLDKIWPGKVGVPLDDARDVGATWED